MKPSHLIALLGVCSLSVPQARAELQPEWVAALPIGSALLDGLSDMVVDAAGVAYVTGISGPPDNTDVITAAIRTDGSVLWQRTYNGPANWHDQGAALALGPGGIVWVSGNTPGPDSFANVLVLGYDAANGALLYVTQFSSGPGLSEHGDDIAVDAQGNLYVGGGTTGDGSDGLLLKFDPAGQFVWKQTWDGPCDAPFSQDQVLQVKLDASGTPIALVHGVMESLHPDYVVLKLSPADGSILWETAWGVNGDDVPEDMVLDSAGDVYVTGKGLQFHVKFSTLKLRGSDGQLVWQAYDQGGIRDAARALALDGRGGLVITGSVDPDGDKSNTNDNIYTVRRDAATGALLWTHLYGANCVGCHDVPSDVVVDPDGHVFVGGSSNTPPLTIDAFTLVLDVSSGSELERGAVSASGLENAGTMLMGFDAAYDLVSAGKTFHAQTLGVEILLFEYDALATSVPEIYCSAKASSCGTQPTLGGPSAMASVSAGTGSFDVTCGPVPAGPKPGVIVYTTNGAALVPATTSFGTLCIQPGPGLFRVPQPALPVGAGCFASYAFDFGGYLAAQSVNPALAAGATVDLQVWYRDPQNSGGANLSNAMSFGLLP